MFKLLIVVIFLVFSHISYAKSFANCKACHKVEKIDSIHKMSCVECHVLRNNRNRLTSHDLIIKNPSSLDYVGRQCSSCHKKDIDNLRKSLHGSLSSAINITRFVWHAQKDYMPIYGIYKAGGFKPIPAPKTSIKRPSDLVDDLLRKKCLRCHLQNNAYPTAGTYRAKGCAACHMAFSLDGKYRGSDRNLYGKVGYSRVHRFYKYPKMSTCLACHNNEFVGTDYMGLFPQDYDRSFRSPILSNGRLKPRIYGIGQHHLSSDLHLKYGLTCVDCHKKNEVMGDGKVYLNELMAVKVRCSSCHGGYISENPDLNYVEKDKHNYVFKSIRGELIKLKLFDKKIIAHKYHSKMSCSACHSAWQFGNFQLNLYLDETRNYKMWKNLIYQEDPYLEVFLKRAFMFPNIVPVMPDYVDGKQRRGVWYSGWLARRWSYFLLIRGEDGLYYTARPLFQFRLTYKNKNGKVVFDDVDNMSVLMPYIPHTTTLYGKSCEDCHSNGFILYPERFNGTVVADFFDGRVLFGRRLNEQEKKKLTSGKYKRVRFSILKKFAEHVFSK